MKINFVLSPSPKVTGGPLAILEYAERLRRRGHDVSITTTPPFSWAGNDSPFPWFQFSGPIYYDDLRFSPQKVTKLRWVRSQLGKVRRSGRQFLKNLQAVARREKPTPALPSRDALSLKARRFANKLTNKTGIDGLMDFYAALSTRPEDALGVHEFYFDAALAQLLMNAMPDCDVNVATFWSTAIPVYFSGKGRPTIFMQHYEEVFYSLDRKYLPARLLTRFGLSLPIYKIANSSWLAKQHERRFGQKIPYSNNALVIDDFSPRPKKSQQDGVLRVVTYSRAEQWKGFQDAVAAMRMILDKFGKRVQWHVFGYLNPSFPPDNLFAPYEYHPKLAFSELAQLYAESDVTLCPSWYESFPLPPLESMASGTAVVTTAYGTEDYAFDGVNSLVVNSRDVPGMVRAVTQLLENPDLRQRLAKAGRAKAEEYSWDRAVDVREKMLQDICDGRVDYDIFAMTRTGLADESGIPFEACPADLVQPPDGKLIRVQNKIIFLLHNGCKRRIMTQTVLNHSSLQGAEIVDVDELTAARIPAGCPIVAPCDL
jgi:glycosyltransferase involved in cell wall biosynthesis